MHCYITAINGKREINYYYVGNKSKHYIYKRKYYSKLFHFNTKGNFDKYKFCNNDLISDSENSRHRSLLEALTIRCVVYI